MGLTCHCSRIYECLVSHRRIAPKPHAFAYRVFMLAIDLDDFPRVKFLSRNRFNLFSIDDRDHIHTQANQGILENLRAWLQENHYNLPADSKITLITFPRVLGYSFNPVSFYYIFDACGEPLVTVAEVTNTFREMKLYLIPYTANRDSEATLPKAFYVSPFSDPNDTFHFHLGCPKESWNVKIDNLSAGKPTLLSSIQGSYRELHSLRLLWYSLKYPLLSLFIICGIHFHALLLYLKKIPYFPKKTPITP